MYCADYGASLVNYNIKRTNELFWKKKHFGTELYLMHPVIVSLELITKTRKRTFLFWLQGWQTQQSRIFSHGKIPIQSKRCAVQADQEKWTRIVQTFGWKSSKWCCTVCDSNTFCLQVRNLWGKTMSMSYFSFQEGFIDMEKFKMCWYHWFKQVSKAICINRNMETRSSMS